MAQSLQYNAGSTEALETLAERIKRRRFERAGEAQGGGEGNTLFPGGNLEGQRGFTPNFLKTMDPRGLVEMVKHPVDTAKEIFVNQPDQAVQRALAVPQMPGPPGMLPNFRRTAELLSGVPIVGPMIRDLAT